jgi:ubiquinone/menaquinone biosynthesis C-methylase UbiE
MNKFRTYLKKVLRVNINEETRDQWLTSKLTSLQPGQKILDAGAGEMRYQRLLTHLHYTSQDICQYDGRGKDGLHTGAWDTARIDIVSDITDIPVPDASFDYVLCTEVFEHVPESTLAFDELVRILRPGGMLIITAPFAAMTHFAPYFFATGFSRFWYERQATRHNLELVELKANGSFFDVVYTYLLISPSIGKKLAGETYKLCLIIALLPALFVLRAFRVKGGADILNFGYFAVFKKKT